jgi:hypothetical protein
MHDRTLLWNGRGSLDLQAFDLTGKLIAAARIAEGGTWRPSSNVPLIIRARSQEGGYRTVRLF